MLTITREIYDRLLAHAHKAAPLEACGYLAAAAGLVCRHYELTNMDQAPDHYAMQPAEQFDAVRNMRRQGLSLAGVYHSHPCTPARPSAEDIRLAFDPAVHYVILSLLTGEEPIRVFRIRQGLVVEEPLIIRADSHAPAENDRWTNTLYGGNMQATTQSDQHKDLRGVGCPMNLVKTKVALRTMQTGQTLELILDDGPPIRNVPEAARREGHQVLEEKQRTDGTWTVRIRKG